MAAATATATTTTTEKKYSISICFCLILLPFIISRIILVSGSPIKSLPGFTGPLPFELETGYVGVDDDDVQLFYYFIKSESNPREDPILLWVTGGPGCSAFSGLVFEIGPLKIKIAEYDGSLPTLVFNPDSWTKVSNIIFLDMPVGTGFSYSKSLQGSKSGDIKSAKQAYTFLRKWLIDHPEFLSNPLYVGGDSYSGITIPIIVQDIADGIEAGDKPIINLKGYLLGNAATDRKLENNSKIPFAHGMGLLSDELYESTKKNCGEEYVDVDPSNGQCIKDLQAVSECTSRVCQSHILEPKCLLVSPKPREMTGNRRSLHENSSKIIFSPPPSPGLECRSYGYMLSYYWANDVSVQRTLNIRKGTVQEWVRCRRDIPYEREVQNSVKYHLNLSSRGYRSLIYSGDHDMIVPFVGTQAWIRSLNYSIIDDWRPWLVDGQVGGYTRTYSNNMTFATVKGGGHTAPEYKPKECLGMFKKWMSNNPL